MSVNFLTDLMVHYEFDETAANSAPGGTDFADSIGANHLTDGGNATYAQGVHGNVTQSFVQPSTASHPPRCAIGSMDWNIPVGGDFTIATWVYHPPSHSSFERIWSMCNTDQSRGLNLKMDNTSTDEVYFVINGVGYITSGSTESLNKEQWNHIVVTHEHGVGLNLYINNVLSDTIAHTSQILPVTTGGLSVLGRFGDGLETLQNAGMAQFSIWDRMFLQADVTAHINKGNGVSFANYGPASTNRSRDRSRER